VQRTPRKTSLSKQGKNREKREPMPSLKNRYGAAGAKQKLDAGRRCRAGRPERERKGSPREDAANGRKRRVLPPWPRPQRGEAGKVKVRGRGPGSALSCPIGETPPQAISGSSRVEKGENKDRPWEPKRGAGRLQILRRQLS